MNPDQNASVGAVRSGFILFASMKMSNLNYAADNIYRTKNSGWIKDC